MTFVSRLALAAAFTLGATALSSVPAFAQKEPQLKVSDAFQKTSALAEAAIKAKDIATAETQVAATEALVKNEDERFYAAWMRLQLELAKNNEPGQIAALEVLSQSPKTPPERIQTYKQVHAYLKGSQLAAQKKHAEAIPLLLQARQLGATQTDLPVLLANSYGQTGNNAAAIKEVSGAIDASKAAGRKPPEDWYKFAIPKVHASGDRAAMISWLNRYIQDYPTGKNWRWGVEVFRQGTPAGEGAAARNERVSLYRLLRATNGLADRGDYNAYSYLVQSAGLPWEAMAVIDEGRKSGKIPAGDSDVQQTYTTAQKQSKAEGSLDALAKTAAAAKDGKSAKQTADAFLASGNNARALELYDLALTKGAIDTDEVNLNRGIALRALGRKDEAKTAFGAVKAGPYANVATLWATSIDLPPLA